MAFPQPPRVNWSSKILWVSAGALVATGSQAQIRPLAGSDGWARREQAIIQQDHSRVRKAAEAAKRHLAHSRMEHLPAADWARDPCPVGGVRDRVPLSTGKRAGSLLFPAFLERRLGPPRVVGSPSEEAADLFEQSISGAVVQARCVNCHVADGLSGHTRLVFVASTTSGHLEQNLQRFADFVTETEGAANLILAKVQGVGHGGGIQVPAGSKNFQNLERFIRALEQSAATDSFVSPDRLFDGVTMAPPATTLRRASLILAGRLPTAAELEQVRNGGLGALRRAIRGLMVGPRFHDFLIRSSNDQLLTDRHLENGILRPRLTREFVSLARTQVSLVRAAIARGYQPPWSDPEYVRWAIALHFGLARAPLELISHVIENDRPYTEVLTARYTMANSVAAEAYGATTLFADPFDPGEFQPSRIVSYYRTDGSKQERYNDVLGRIIDHPGNLATDYPHVGILNTNAFLRRYPSTDTSRNRARSRWTYYFFLNEDISRAASRTTDPDALADRDNPTLKNPACTVCHRLLDPVAGAFQNYGDHGLYKDQFGGIDSLPLVYKQEPGTAYRNGDRWYRDMLAPGFGEFRLSDPDRSLRWLAEQIVADERFALATVRFWWPAIMGADITRPPEDPSDPGHDAQLLAATAQQAEVERIADMFRRGFQGGRPYDGKDLLAEIFLSPWFRADSLAKVNPLQSAALRDAGARRLLTPEELARKTEMVSGYVWGRSSWRRAEGSNALDRSFLDDDLNNSSYGILYGGIDSGGITERTREMTPVMMAVARTHAAEVSCPIVEREFFFWPPERRRLFGGIDKFATPGTREGSLVIRRKIAELHRILLGIDVAIDSRDVEDVYELFADVWRQGPSSASRLICGGFSQDIHYWEGLVESAVEYTDYGSSYRLQWENVHEYVNKTDTSDPFGTVRAWAVVLNYMLTDYRYLYL